MHYTAPLVDEAVPRRFGGPTARFGLLGADDCGSTALVAAGALHGLPLRGGSAAVVVDSSTTAALHLLVAICSTLLPNCTVTTAPDIRMTLYGPCIAALGVAWSSFGCEHIPGTWWKWPDWWC